MKDLQGKVAVVTGGASGIGKGMAKRFAKAGARIVLADIETGPLEATAKEMRESGAEVLTQITDVSDADAVEALAEATVVHFGAVHVVCNNAGVGGGVGPMWQLSLNDWKFTMGPNLWGVIHGVRSFAPRLIEQNEGHFVNTASMAGLVSLGNMGPYNVTKQGVVALSETLFEDLRNAGSDVGVSVLCPAFVRTQIWDSDRNRPEEFKNEGGPSPEHEGGKQILKAVIENAMPTEEVADAVHDAILAKQLYILTHEATRERLASRMNNIITGTNPAAATGDISSLQGN